MQTLTTAARWTAAAVLALVGAVLFGDSVVAGIALFAAAALATPPVGRRVPMGGPALAAAIMVLVVGGLMAWSVVSDPHSGDDPLATAAAEPAPEPAPAYRPNPVAAYVMCQRYVSQQLRAPGSARYPSIGASGVQSEHQGDGRYLVRGYVDSQNAFGALLRAQWLCEIEHDGASDAWRSLGVVVDG
jgi:hypothetical protein